MSFFLFGFLTAGFTGSVSGLACCASSGTGSSCTGFGALGVSSLARFAICSPWGWSSGLLRFVVVGVMNQSQGDGSAENGKRDINFFLPISLFIVTTKPSRGQSVIFPLQPQIRLRAIVTMSQPQDVAEQNIQMWKVKKLIKSLDAARGSVHRRHCLVVSYLLI